jgi:hypothetical protein
MCDIFNVIKSRRTIWAELYYRCGKCEHYIEFGRPLKEATYGT